MVTETVMATVLAVRMERALLGQVRVQKDAEVLSASHTRSRSQTEISPRKKGWWKPRTRRYTRVASLQP